MTSALIGASSVDQLRRDNVAALDRLDFSDEELSAEIERYATESGINIWAVSSEA